jgi:hypothetical protein
MSNENGNGLVDLFDDLMSGRKTVEQIKAELKESKIYLRAGKNYRELKFNGFAKIEGASANVYVAAEKIDNTGAKVEPKPRAAKHIKGRK